MWFCLLILILHFTTFLILQDKFCGHIQKYAFFLYYKIGPPEAVGEVPSQVPGKSCDEVDDDVWNSYYSNFGSEIWR